MSSKHRPQSSISSQRSQKSTTSRHSRKPASRDLSEPSSPPHPTLLSPAGPVDIIGYERTPVGSSDDIHTVAQTVLGRALRGAEYGGAGDDVSYGNLAGRELLDERYSLKERTTRLEQQVKGLQDEQKKTNVLITELQDRVSTLTLALEGYRKIRHRFLEVYRRDVLEDLNREGRQKIGKGNEAAHEGDAVADADLYASGERTDVIVFLNLYELIPDQVLKLYRAGDTDSISVVNAGATWKAKGSNSIPPDVAATLDMFIKELNFNWGKSPTDGTSRLGKAYYAFWGAQNKYK